MYFWLCCRFCLLFVITHFGIVDFHIVYFGIISYLLHNMYVMAGPLKHKSRLVRKPTM